MARKNQKQRKAEAEPTFEEAFERLTEIAAELETGEISLDDSIRRYEEGMKLIAHCQRILQEAEQKVELLAKKADESLAPEPFDRAGAAAEAPDVPDAPESLRGKTDESAEGGALFE